MPTWSGPSAARPTASPLSLSNANRKTRCSEDSHILSALATSSKYSSSLMISWIVAGREAAYCLSRCCVANLSCGKRALRIVIPEKQVNFLELPTSLVAMVTWDVVFFLTVVIGCCRVMFDVKVT